MAGASLPAFAENGAGYERAKTGRGKEQGGNAAHQEVNNIGEVPTQITVSAILLQIRAAARHTAHNTLTQSKHQ